MKLWGEIPHLQVVPFELHECGSSVEWSVGWGLEAFSTGALRQKATLLQSPRISEWENGNRKGLGLARAFALVSVRWPLFPRHLGPWRVFPDFPVCDPLLSFLGSPKVEPLR